MSSSNYILQEILPDQVAEVAHFLENLPSGGKIGLNLYRRPSFFDALEVEGTQSEVWAVRETQSNTIAGVVLFHTKKVHIQGQEYLMGIVGSLRVLPEHRGGRTMRLFLKLLKDWLHRSGIHFAISSVFSDNKEGNALFEHEGSYLPIRRKLGIYRTAFYNPRYLSRLKSEVTDIEIVPGSQYTTEQLLDIFYTLNHGHDLVPAYHPQQLKHGTELLKGINTEHAWVARSSGKAVAMLCLWNQSAFRAWQVQAYPAALRILRTPINLMANAQKMPTLPGMHNAIEYGQIALAGYSDVQAFLHLLKLSGQLATRKKWHSIALGSFTHASDFETLPRKQYSFHNNIYFIGVHNDDIYRKLRHLYLELGSL